jgi:hypothetical protein
MVWTTPAQPVGLSIEVRRVAWAVTVTAADG